jgi:hypothetical protein
MTPESRALDRQNTSVQAKDLVRVSCFHIGSNKIYMSHVTLCNFLSIKILFRSSVGFEGESAMRLLLQG